MEKLHFMACWTIWDQTYTLSETTRKVYVGGWGGGVYKTIYWKLQNYGPLEKINKWNEPYACSDFLSGVTCRLWSHKEILKREGNFIQWRRHKSEFQKMVGEERAVWRKSSRNICKGIWNLLLNTKLHVHKIKVHEVRQTPQELHAKQFLELQGWEATSLETPKKLHFSIDAKPVLAWRIF